MHRWRTWIVALALVAAGSTAACSSGQQEAGQGGLIPVGSSGPSGPSAAATAPSTAASPSVSAAASTQPASTVHLSASVTALSASFRGLCAPPSDATTFKAVISVSGVLAGHPVTVRWHWRTRHGGDSDPSVQSHTFNSSGSYTTTHHESAYPASPYPKELDDWAAVVVSTDGTTITSGHAAYSIHCLPWVAVLVGNNTSYSGGCPPPPSGLTFTVHISVSYPMEITYHWHTSNGADSDPSSHTMNVVPGASLVVDHSETSYSPAATTNDHVAVTVSGAGMSGDSNTVDYTETCTS
jgi:hypothetical protein